MKLTFIDLDADVVEALKKAFARFPEVSVVSGDLVALADDTIVSPANADGLMDGGIDAAYAAAIPKVQERVRDAILRRPEGHLPLGAAVLVPVSHARVKFVIAATTMLTPEMVDSQNAYRAMRAVLRVASEHPEHVQSIYCPGLCTGVGTVRPEEAAAAMARAYSDWKKCLTAGE